LSERLHEPTSECINAPVREYPLATISQLIILRISGLLSARLILNLREWSDRTSVHVSHRAGPSANPRQFSSTMPSFHAATVGRLTSSDEFGGDPLDDVRHDLDINEEER
jgi:hypothetical protein